MLHRAGLKTQSVGFAGRRMAEQTLNYSWVCFWRNVNETNQCHLPFPIRTEHARTAVFRSGGRVIKTQTHETWHKCKKLFKFVQIFQRAMQIADIFTQVPALHTFSANAVMEELVAKNEDNITSLQIVGFKPQLASQRT